MEQEYTLSPGMKIFYGLIAIGMIAFATYLFNMGYGVAPAILLIPIFLIAGGVLMIINLLKRKVLIDQQGIQCINLFSKKELTFNAIKGCRVGEKAIIIEPVSPADPSITIGNYIDFSNSDQLAKWFKEKFKDLDALDLEEERKTVLHNTELGITEADRSETLKKAKNKAIVYNSIGMILGFTMIFFRGRPGLLILLIYPLVGVLLMIFSKGTIKFLSNAKRSVLSYIFPGATLPGFILFIRAMDEYDLFQIKPLWAPALLTTGTLLVLFYTTGINRSIRIEKAQIIIMLIVSLLYGFGSTIQVNCLFDRSKSKMYEATVLNHRVSHGKSNSYYLSLSPWGPRKEEKEVTIHRRLYIGTGIGDTVTINFREGLLHIPWFIVSKKTL